MAESVEEVCAAIIKLPGMAAGCNIFVQAVAAKYGKEAFVAGNADVIRLHMTSAPFVAIGNRPLEATRLATEGKLVLGALSKAELTYQGNDKRQHNATMGHVVVVVPGGPSKGIDIILTNGAKQPCRGGYPYCYQGAANSAYRFTARTQVDAVFPSKLLDSVFYAYLDI